MKTKFKNRILFGLSGSVAAYRACNLISALAKEAHDVRCVMTRGAQEFITPLTLETLSKQKVFTDTFESSPFDKALHIGLAEFPEVIVLMPATANILAKASLGLSDDLLSCVLLSTQAPVLVVPAMNTQMWENPATQENIKRLRDRGFHFVDPIHAELSCGTVGVGHIAEDEKILEAIQKILNK